MSNIAEPKKIVTPPTPNYIWSILSMHCPRCRRGPMFKDANPFRKLTLGHIFDMPDRCAVCNQKFDLEPGFWYGTGYVSYGLAVGLSFATFALWWLFVGISVSDNRVFWWLIVNAITLLALQPWLMRLSRSIYIRFFVRYDPHYEHTAPVKFD